jgi:hypothetical protein
MPTPRSERSLRASAAAHASWARTADRSARTAPAHDGLEQRIAREYGIPDDLPEDQRALRLANAKKAYFASLALKSVRARRKARELAAEADAADAELAQLPTAG